LKKVNLKTRSNLYTKLFIKKLIYNVQGDVSLQEQMEHGSNSETILPWRYHARIRWVIEIFNKTQ